MPSFRSIGGLLVCLSLLAACSTPNDETSHEEVSLSKIRARVLVVLVVLLALACASTYSGQVSGGRYTDPSGEVSVEI